MGDENKNSGANPTTEENLSSRQRNIKTKSNNDPDYLLIDESYDESTDPDYTLSNATIIEISDIDEDDDGMNLNDEETINLSDSDTETESTNEDEKDDDKTKILNNTLNSSQSSVSLPIHKHFHSFIHKHEIPRKLFHVSIGFITLYLHCTGYKTSNTWQPVSIVVSCIFLLDMIRFKWPYFNKLYCSTVGFLMREKEINSINGVIWFQIGSILTFMFQKQDVSIMSVLLLSWSDTAASTVGRKFGYLSPKLSRGKSLIGSIAAFITGIIACYVFYGIITPKFPQFSNDFEYDPNSNMLNIHTLALLSGFIAALSEGIDIADMDDNLTIPIMSGIFLSNIIKLGKVL